ncbi:MAG: ABC transporter ATP-binding protein [Fibrobacteres bacterium]|jgi:peptide/nickel transport system ATP-binding protein|nr:ABC transporter ATP-binding protein [Fibrobacterota bacterium]
MLQVSDLTVAFKGERDFVPVTKGVSFDLAPGATLGIVGESGSGKSVTSLALMGLLPRRSARVTATRMAFAGKDLLALPPREMRALRGKDIAMVFQDPMTSLNPLMRCGEQIAETIRFHQGKGRGQAKLEAVALLDRMGIPDPGKRSRTYPFEMSGGMRQRVMIAIALSCRPKLLIADEPTTALDVTIQAQILRLIRELQKDFGMALMLITHDLGIVKDTVEDLLVMYAGRIVERGKAAQLLKRPSHPYTLGLLRSIPSLSGKSERLASIEGVVPKPSDTVPGCRFHPRCFMSVEACKRAEPPLVGEAGQASACIRREELLKDAA